MFGLTLPKPFLPAYFNLAEVSLTTITQHKGLFAIANLRHKMQDGLA